MISPENINTLRTATQEILNNRRDFSEDIAPAINSVAEHAPDEWSRARIRKLPVVAAFSHSIAIKAMRRIEQGIIVPSGENAYEAYLSLTEGIDKIAGQEAIDELSETGGTFSAAIAYFKTQIESMNHVADTTPELIQRKGKIAGTAATEPPEELLKLLANPMAVNARGTTMSLIIGEALRICLREEGLPESHIISRELRLKAANLADLTQQPTAVFQLNVASKEMAQKTLQQIRLHNRLEISVSQWPAILKEVLANGTVPPAAYELGHPPHNESQKSRKLGHCAAQLYLQPYERPNTLDANGALATRYFDARGFILTANTFRTVDYQLLRSIEVAEDTIFSDPACRMALEALARYVRGNH